MQSFLPYAHLVLVFSPPPAFSGDKYHEIRTSTTIITNFKLSYSQHNNNILAILTIWLINLTHSLFAPKLGVPSIAGSFFFHFFFRSEVTKKEHSKKKNSST